MDDTDRMIAGLLGWLMIGAIPIALVINLVIQSLNRPWRKYLHHRKIHARWREICEEDFK